MTILVVIVAGFVLRYWKVLKNLESAYLKENCLKILSMKWLKIFFILKIKKESTFCQKIYYEV